MIINFKKQKVTETKALVGIIIPELIYNLKIDKLEDWFRKLFGINNAMFVSRNSDNTSYTLVIFENDIKECDNNTKLIYTTTGEDTGTYSMPIYHMGFIIDNLNSENIKEFLENAKNIKIN